MAIRDERPIRVQLGAVETRKIAPQNKTIKFLEEFGGAARI